jgi:endonuclease/exonuclease/phosphatase (EEP) superfamily protein YafD
VIIVPSLAIDDMTIVIGLASLQETSLCSVVVPASSDATMPKSCRRIGGIGLSAAAALATLGAAWARHSARPARPVAVAAAAAPPVAVASAAVGLLLAANRRTRGPGFAAAALSAAALTVQLAPSWRNRVPSASTTLRVTSANILLGRADAPRLAAWAASHTDVLVVQELTPESVARLDAAGLDEVFAHRMVEPRSRASGIGVWSRYPITTTRHVDDLAMPCLAVKVRVPGCLLDPTIVAVHLHSPVDIEGWRTDLATLPSVLRDLDAWSDGSAVIVAGDFNSTRDMRPFRDGLAGYADAAEQAGATYSATFPDSRRWTVPLFVIDHVLTLRCTATEVHTAGIASSDHRALVASIHVD